VIPRYYLQPNQRWIDSAVDRLAELLSQGFTINDASERMGVTRGTGCVLFRDLCARVGERVQ
jgi:hypothetical protein